MGDPSASDGALVAAAAAGDARAFQQLMERHQQAIFGYLYRLTFRDVDAARDLAQATFLKAYEHLASVDPARPFTPWLYRIAHNEAVNWMRTRRRHPEAHLEPQHWESLPAANQSSPEGAEGQAQERRLLLEALDGLPARYREVLVLYFFEERPYEEIAAILDVRLGTVGTLIHRAKEQLRVRLEGKVQG